MRSLTAVVVASVTLLATSLAVAEDTAPCGAPFWSNLARTNVRYCPDWSPDGRIAVWPHPDRWIDQPVGYLENQGRRTNWYICQRRADSYCEDGYCNNVWAKTYADNGRVGWVNEVYFQGGGNNEADGNLPPCP